MRRTINLSCVLILSCPLIALMGCGGSNKTATVSGKVTYNGAPVTGGTLMFYSEGKTEPTPGPINADGTFAFGGVPTGPMKVVVETDSVKKQVAGDYMHMDKMKPPEGKGPTGMVSTTPPVYVKIPAKYLKPDKTDLTCDVKSGSNSFNFELKD
jgi:hypothetical protein